LTELATKKHILENAGYRYSFDRELYVNRDTKKAFSVEFVEDHSEREIVQHIHEDAPGRREWHFFFNEPPSDAVKRELNNVLG
jgi:hypothetical protein